MLVVALLVGVLSAFSVTAVNYLIGSLDSDRDSAAETRSLYLVELGRADAFAYVVGHPEASWPHSRTLTAVLDDQDVASGEYSYTITDLTLPEQNERRRVQVDAYWPDQARAVAENRLYFWMEESGGTWAITAWTLGTYAGG